MKRNLPNIIIWLIAIAIFGGCTSSKYDEMVKKELASGIVQDSLFLGIKFGMSQKEFYGHCWELNKQQLVSNGPENNSVMYDLKGLKHEAKLYFYPTFENDRIYKMPVTIAYTAWAPWRKDLFSDSLQLDVLNLFEEWYGKGFMEIKHSKKGSAFVKVDGNRRISIYKVDDSHVGALFTDLKLEKELEGKLN